MRNVILQEKQRAQDIGHPTRPVSLKMVEQRTTDLRKYNAPTANEVAVVFTGYDRAPPTPRDIRIYRQGDTFSTITKHSPNCDPLCYGLLSSRRQAGWCIGLMSEHGQQKVSMQVNYAYRLFS